MFSVLLTKYDWIFWLPHLSNDFENKKLIYWLEGEVSTPFFFPDDRLSRPQIVFNKETASFYETSANIYNNNRPSTNQHYCLKSVSKSNNSIIALFTLRYIYQNIFLKRKSQGSHTTQMMREGMTILELAVKQLY